MMKHLISKKPKKCLNKLADTTPKEDEKAQPKEDEKNNIFESLTDKLTFSSPITIIMPNVKNEEEEPPIITKEQLFNFMITNKKEAVEIDSEDDIMKIIRDDYNTAEDNHKDEEEIPIYIVNEYQTKRSTKPITTLPFIYEKDIRWALKPRGSTILKINYELVKTADPLFYQALNASYLNLDLDGAEKPTLKQYRIKVINELKENKYAL